MAMNIRSVTIYDDTGLQRINRVRRCADLLIETIACTLTAYRLIISINSGAVA